MKKLIAALLAAVLILTLAGCGKKSASGSLDVEKAQSAIAGLELMPAATMNLDDATLTDVYGVDASLLQSYLCVVPMMNVHASGYWLLLPKEGELDAVKAQIESYLETYQASWDQYLPDQAELVRNRLATTLETAEGTWLVYVVSENNDKVLEAIQGAVA